VAVIGIVVLWEKRPLASLWLRPFQWQSLARAGVLVIVHFIVLFPATEWVRRNAGLSDYTIGMETALAHSVWLRILAAVTAGVVEETLFRGFAVTRLIELSGSTFWAVFFSSGVFALLHLPVWGGGPSLVFFIGSLATSAFFVWRRDLLAVIIAHATIDAWALAIGPSRHGGSWCQYRADFARTRSGVPSA
jgi:membrane protease YdiL (CAAX protease family)